MPWMIVDVPAPAKRFGLSVPRHRFAVQRTASTVEMDDVVPGRARWRRRGHNSTAPRDNMPTWHA
jgi:hypothetical protein